MCQTRTLLHPCAISVGNSPPLPMWNQSCKFLGEDSEYKNLLSSRLTHQASQSSPCLLPQPVTSPLAFLPLYKLTPSPRLVPIISGLSSSLHRDRQGGYSGHSLLASASTSPLHWHPICIFDSKEIPQDTVSHENLDSSQLLCHFFLISSCPLILSFLLSQAFLCWTKMLLSWGCWESGSQSRAVPVPATALHHRECQCLSSLPSTRPVIEV